MSDLRTNLLPVFNQVRKLMKTLNFRRHSVMVRTITWSGARVGLGTKTIVDTPIVLDDDNTPPKVTLITSEDIIASGGLYQQGDYLVDKITPAFSGGGLEVNDFELPVGSQPTEILYQLIGPEFPEGAWFKKVSTETYRNFRYSFVLRKLGST